MTLLKTFNSILKAFPDLLQVFNIVSLKSILVFQQKQLMITVFGKVIIHLVQATTIYNPCHKLVAKREKKLQEFVAPPSPDFEVFFL